MNDKAPPERRARGTNLTAEEPDRAAREARTITLAATVFANRKKAHAWLHKTLASLDGRRPMDLIRTTSGTRFVEEILAKIAWGAPS